METRKKRSNLFLLELMIAVFFFSIISAVCVQLFSEAYSLSKKSTDLTKAVNLAGNLAEGIQSWDGSIEQWEKLFPGGNWQEDQWQIVYDAEWQPILAQKEQAPAEESALRQGCNLLQIQLETEDSTTAYIMVSKVETGEVIYELEIMTADRREAP